MCKNKINFWCKNDLHFWEEIMPMINNHGTITYDTNNEWRKCKKCNKTQIRRGIYDEWEDK